ncbi:hypothetical protein [Fluviispira vulneris]|uniref:hypothetical protein n=1 Tax=Fluviispira vulneris TaxID=2763012 RepID=UPI0016459446|nr:hypothetical protein [Fluviispira vulneris]
MRKKAIAILCFFVFACTLYSLAMLYAQYQLTVGLDKSIQAIKQKPPYPDHIEFSRITLSPIFFINKNFYIKDLIFISKEHNLNIYIKNLSVKRFVKNGTDFQPLSFEANKIKFFYLDKLKEFVKSLDKYNKISNETLDYLLNQSTFDLKGEYFNNNYEFKLNLKQNERDLIDCQWVSNDLPFVGNNSSLKFFIKKLSLNIKNMPISLKENLKTNHALKDVLGPSVDTIYANINFNFNKTKDNNYVINLNLTTHKIFSIFMNASFYIEDIFSFNHFKFIKSNIIFEDLNFINNYFWRKSLEDNLTFEEEKRRAIQQNNTMLIFVSKTPLEKAIFEFNKFIENPKYFFISINPERPIEFIEIQEKSQRNILNLLQDININFKAYRDKNHLEKDVSLPRP